MNFYWTNRCKLCWSTMKQLSKLPQKRFEKRRKGFERTKKPIRFTGELLTTNCSYKFTLTSQPTKIFWEVPVFYQHFKIFLSELRDSFPSPLPFFCMSSKKCCWDEVIRVSSRTMTGLTLDLCLTDFGHQYVTNLNKIKRFFCLHHDDQLECYISVSCVVPPYHNIISLWILW